MGSFSLFNYPSLLLKFDLHTWSCVVGIENKVWAGTYGRGQTPTQGLCPGIPGSDYSEVAMMHSQAVSSWGEACNRQEEFPRRNLRPLNGRVGRSGSATLPFRPAFWESQALFTQALSVVVIFKVETATRRPTLLCALNLLSWTSWIHLSILVD